MTISQPTILETKLDKLWAEYVQARDAAVASGKMEDGIAAGRAWSSWLAEFVPHGVTRDVVHGTLSRLGKQ